MLSSQLSGSDTSLHCRSTEQSVLHQQAPEGLPEAQLISTLLRDYVSLTHLGQYRWPVLQKSSQLSFGTLYDAEVLRESSRKNGIGGGAVAPTGKLPAVALASYMRVPLVESQPLHLGSSREGSRTPPTAVGDLDAVSGSWLWLGAFATAATWSDPEDGQALLLPVLCLLNE